MWPPSGVLPLAVALCGPPVVIPSIYTQDALSKILRNETMPSGCQIFPPSAAVVPDRRRPSDHPAVLQECPTDLHERPAVAREGPAPSPRGPSPSSSRAPPLLPWTAASLSSSGAPPTDDLLPECHHPSSLPGWRPPPRRTLPQPPARNRRRQHRRRLRRQLRRPRSPPTPHLLTARHAWRPWMGPTAQQRQPRLGCFFFFFFKMQLHVLKMWINRLWINAITWTMDK
jgi:hypothetical protein